MDSQIQYHTGGDIPGTCGTNGTYGMFDTYGIYDTYGMYGNVQWEAVYCETRTALSCAVATMANMRHPPASVAFRQNAILRRFRSDSRGHDGSKSRGVSFTCTQDCGAQRAAFLERGHLTLHSAASKTQGHCLFVRTAKRTISSAIRALLAEAILCRLHYNITHLQGRG